MQQKSNRRGGNSREEKSPYDQAIVDLARVTRVTKGGKHLSFRALVVIGDRRGKVGYGVAKGADVQIAVDKSSRQAKKRLVSVQIVKDTIPHPIFYKFKAAKIMLMPAPRGSGVIAGGAVRTVLEMAGIPNVSAKIVGKTKNKIALVKAAFEALQSFKQQPKTHVVKAAPSEEKK